MDLLARLHASVLVPPAVLREFGPTPEWIQETPPASPILALALALVLGPGESEAIALASERGCPVILDDHQARAAAARVGVEVIGTVGVLLRAKRAGLVPVLGTLLDELDAAGFRVDSRLRQKALELAGEVL